MLSIADAVLVEAIDDWVPLRAIDGLVQRTHPRLESGERRAEVIDALRVLVGLDLVEIGEVSGASFNCWNGPRSSWLERIEQKYGSGAIDTWGFGIWVSNTPAGDASGEALLARQGIGTETAAADEV
ncbi:hypothetical protein SAMN05444157_3082 [Frankineae bacterium MT45]|nr:hypothetical protein SAMN05444157_3082 [Frankineae bacterium MT45]